MLTLLGLARQGAGYTPFALTFKEEIFKVKKNYD